MPTKSEIIGTVKLKMEDGTFVDLPYPISLEEITAFAEQYEFVRVVRCKECKHSEEAFLPNRELWCNAHEIHCTSDWFCKDGKRREDDSD